MPHSIWFSVVISSDIFLYLTTTLFFYFAYRNDTKPLTLPLVVTAILLVKPTGIIFAVASLIILQENERNHRLRILSQLYFLFLIVFFAIFYLPYFLVEQVIIESSDELRSISHHALDPYKLISKFFHMFGFHRSESNMPLLELSRYFYGSLFVLGLMNILMTRGTIWLIVLMVGLLGFILTSSVPTWRYLLPYFPYFS